MQKPLFFLVFLYLIIPIQSFGQDDDQFRMEFGGGVGTSFYVGDLNNKLFNKQNPALNITWKYLFDPHNSLKLSLAAGGIKGSTSNIEDFFPDIENPTPSVDKKDYSFSGTISDLSCIYELNFWPYGYYSNYLGHKRLTPFIQFGLGFTYSSIGKNVAANLPIGLGIKYRLGRRLNLSLDWSMHFCMSDKLDGLSDPLGIRSETPKNKDNYGLTMISLTYSFSPICVACNKANK